MHCPTASFNILGQRSRHNETVGFMCVPDMPYGAEGVFAVCRSARSHPKDLLTQIGIARSCIEYFVKSHVGFSPANHVVALHHVSASGMGILELMPFGVRHSLTCVARAQYFHVGHQFPHRKKFLHRHPGHHHTAAWQGDQHTSGFQLQYRFTKRCARHTKVLHERNFVDGISR